MSYYKTRIQGEKVMSNVNIVMNNEKNGIEIRFGG